jgi:16S rRNA (guanine966-N2)-methyltransferase
MPLRVIGGELGGRVLRGPPRSGVRPTTDRVREALFEILAARDVPMKRVLDLYSGTGALGIEALSRGAEYCDFVESDPKACDVIRENLRLTGLKGNSKLWPVTVAKAIQRLAEGEAGYDLVLADPPYDYDRAEAELALVVEKGLLAEEGTVVVEHSQRKEWPPTLAGLEQVTSRRYGDTRVTIYA